MSTSTSGIGGAKVFSGEHTLSIADADADADADATSSAVHAMEEMVGSP